MQLTQKKWVKEYFTFSQKERRAVIILAICATLFALLPTMFPFLVKNDIQLVNNPEVEKQLTHLKVVSANADRNFDDGESVDQLYQPKSGFTPSKEWRGSLFYFDPNTASESDWQKLGLRDKTIRTILNYRSKGGKFRHAEDLSKIYGLHENEYQNLFPFVKIESADANSTSYNKASEIINAGKSSTSKTTTWLIDINSADTTEFKKLYGIGSKLSQRIISFRSKLGGFITIDQVAETYGLPDSTYQKIKEQLRVNTTSIKRLNINTATTEELKTHPYIRYVIANAIVQYRSQHGDYSDVTEIQKTGAIDEDVFRKISPYLTTD